jgi:hypothetical protein
MKGTTNNFLARSGKLNLVVVVAEIFIPNQEISSPMYYFDHDRVFLSRGFDNTVTDDFQYYRAFFC